MTTNINEALTQIKGAVYGKDVRQAIADGIQIAYDDASKTGNANMEVSMARGTHGTLKQRLDIDKAYLDSKISSVGSGGPHGVFINYDALKNTFPNGDDHVYLVSADSNWYFWNGMTWIPGGVYQATKIAEKDKGLFINQGSIYPLDNVFRDGATHDVDQGVKDAILFAGVIGANPGKYYGIDWLGNGYDDAGTIRYGMTIVEYDKQAFSFDSTLGKRNITYYKTNNFEPPTTQIVTRTLYSEVDDMTIVVVYDSAKIGSVLRVTEPNYGTAKGAIISESNYVYKPIVDANKGNLLNNQGKTYPFKNVLREGQLHGEISAINAGILDVKVNNARPGKIYKIDWVGNGTTAWGDPNYSVYLQEMDPDFTNIRQVFSRHNQKTPAPTQSIETRFIEIAGEPITLSVTIDYSKFTSDKYVMNVSGYGYGYIIDPSCYNYVAPSIFSGVSNDKVVAVKKGRTIRTKFRYNDTKDMVLDFDPLGINAITHLKRIYTPTNTSGYLDSQFTEEGLQMSISTDWVSPYGIKALNNALTTAAFTVGGNHGTNNGEGFATARHIETKVYVDGKELADGEVVSSDYITIKAIHHISASNVIDLTNGAKRDSVKEIVTYTITPRHVKVSTEIEALEDVVVTRYFGLQATQGIWNKILYFMEDTIQQKHDISLNDDAVMSGVAPTSHADRFVLKKDNNVLMGYINNDLGVGEKYIADGQNLIYLTEGGYGKVYKHTIKGTEVQFLTGDSMYYVGGYIMAPDITKTVADTACSYYIDGEKVYVLDFFEAGETYFLPDNSDLNKEISVIKKSDTITIDSYITGKGIKIKSTGYGQLFFKLK